MLVTFSATGADAPTLTKFCKDESPQTPLEKRPRSLQVPRVRKRSQLGMNKAQNLLFPNDWDFPSSQKQYSKIRTLNIPPYNIEPYLKHCGKGAPGREGTPRSTRGPLITSASKGSKYETREKQQTHNQFPKPSNAVANSSSFLYQPLMRYNSAPLPQASSSSPLTCIDPRLLSKSFVPERKDPIFATAAEPESVIRESLNFKSNYSMTDSSSSNTRFSAPQFARTLPIDSKQGLGEFQAFSIFP